MCNAHHCMEIHYLIHCIIIIQPMEIKFYRKKYLRAENLRIQNKAFVHLKIYQMVSNKGYLPINPTFASV